MATDKAAPHLYVGEMKSYFLLSDEARHAIKVFDLDSLEGMIEGIEARYDAASFYEMVFYGLRKRKNVSQDTILEWIERFIAWLYDEDHQDSDFPLTGTDWALDMIEIGEENDRLDLSLKCLDTVIESYALLQSSGSGMRSEAKFTSKLENKTPTSRFRTTPNAAPVFDDMRKSVKE